MGVGAGCCPEGSTDSERFSPSFRSPHRSRIGKVLVQRLTVERSGGFRFFLSPEER